MRAVCLTYLILFNLIILILLYMLKSTNHGSLPHTLFCTLLLCLQFYISNSLNLDYSLYLCYETE